MFAVDNRKSYRSTGGQPASFVGGYAAIRKDITLFRQSIHFRHIILIGKCDKSVHACLANWCSSEGRVSSLVPLQSCSVPNAASICSHPKFRKSRRLHVVAGARRSPLAPERLMIGFGIARANLPVHYVRDRSRTSPAYSSLDPCDSAHWTIPKRGQSGPAHRIAFQSFAGRHRRGLPLHPAKARSSQY